jgi:hypothetical protein
MSMRESSKMKQRPYGMVHISSGHHLRGVAYDHQQKILCWSFKLTIKYGDVEISSPRSMTSISVRVSRAADRLAA